MHRIDGLGATIDNRFTEGNPVGGVQATQVTDDWCNGVQEEICHVIEQAGITLTKGDTTQLYDAIVYYSNELPRGYIDGLTLKNNATDPNNDVDIEPGKARDSSDACNLTLSMTLTKQLDAAWAQGSDQGGLFTGSKANDQWYHVHLIRNDTSGAIDAGFDTSVVAANAPAGWSSYRRAGSILTDSSGNVLPFTQRRDFFTWATTITDHSVSSVTGLIGLSVPPGVSVLTRLLALSGTSGNDTRFTIVDGDTVVWGVGVYSLVSVLSSVVATGNSHGGELQLVTNTNAQVRVLYIYTTYGISTLGWLDNRGKE